MGIPAGVLEGLLISSLGFRDHPVAIPPQVSCLHLFKGMPKKISVAKAKQASTAPVPDSRDLKTLRNAAKTCKACPLWLRGTQTVFGEGSAQAQVMLVGEQ